MQLTITTVDYAPADLCEQVPIVVNLIRQMPGDDREDYWVGVLKTPIRWLVENRIRQVTHLVVAARWQGTSITKGVKNLPIGIAYVIDESILNDARLDLPSAHTSRLASPLKPKAVLNPIPWRRFWLATLRLASAQENQSENSHPTNRWTGATGARSEGKRKTQKEKEIARPRQVRHYARTCV